MARSKPRAVLDFLSAMFSDNGKDELPPHETAPIGDGEVVYLRYASADSCEELLAESLRLTHELSLPKKKGEKVDPSVVKELTRQERLMCREAIVRCARKSTTLDSEVDEITTDQAQYLLVKASQHERKPFMRTQLAEKAMMLSGLSVPRANPTSEQ